VTSARALLASLSFFSWVACRSPLPAGKTSSQAAPPEPVILRDALTPDGVPLSMTCTATGTELCFDATDNNCNGVIDEGCGVDTGPLQFAIAWPEGSDVDLEVYDPSGNLAKPGERSEGAMAKDRDCGRPQSSCHGQNMENVYFVGARPPPGRYRVEIKLDKPDDVRFPVKVRFGGRIGGKTFALDVELASPEDAKVFGVAIE
jgi:tRNA (guanosine-2'-O-)-methyltransferase